MPHKQWEKEGSQGPLGAAGEIRAARPRLDGSDAVECNVVKKVEMGGGGIGECGESNPVVVSVVQLPSAQIWITWPRDTVTSGVAITTILFSATIDLNSCWREWLLSKKYLYAHGKWVENIRGKQNKLARNEQYQTAVGKLLYTATVRQIVHKWRPLSTIVTLSGVVSQSRSRAKDVIHQDGLWIMNFINKSYRKMSDYLSVNWSSRESRSCSKTTIQNTQVIN